MGEAEREDQRAIVKQETRDRRAGRKAGVQKESNRGGEMWARGSGEEWEPSREGKKLGETTRGGRTNTRKGETAAFSLFHCNRYH